jgi:hypothetical protein
MCIDCNGGRCDIAYELPGGSGTMVAGKGAISKNPYIKLCGWGPLTTTMPITIVEDGKEEKA